MRPEDLVSTADAILTYGDRSEAECRMVAHACYYAALHLAAPHVGVDVQRDHDRHRKTREALKSSRFVGTPPAHVVALANYFEDLTRLRIHADYNYGIPFDADRADQALEWMRGIISRIAP